LMVSVAENVRNCRCGSPPAIDLSPRGANFAARGPLRARVCARYGVLVIGEEMKGSRVKRWASASRSRSGSWGTIHGSILFSGTASPSPRGRRYRRRCALAILARPAVVFGPVDNPILSFPLQSLRPHNARTRARSGEESLGAAGALFRSTSPASATHDRICFRETAAHYFYLQRSGSSDTSPVW
jgi:hypothetical protein